MVGIIEIAVAAATLSSNIWPDPCRPGELRLSHSHSITLSTPQFSAHISPALHDVIPIIMLAMADGNSLPLQQLYDTHFGGTPTENSCLKVMIAALWRSMGEFLSVGAFSLPGHCSLLEGGHGGGNGGHAWRQNGAAANT